MVISENLVWTTTHKSDYDRLLKTYYNIRGRCYNKNIPNHKYYGARGIKMCKEWLADYNLFIDWSVKNGWKPYLQIDRIDTSKSYTPTNCRWTTQDRNVNNRRNNITAIYKGAKYTLSELVCLFNVVNYDAAHNRVSSMGWDPIKAANTPSTFRK